MRSKKTKKQSAGEKDAVQANKKARRRRKSRRAGKQKKQSAGEKDAVQANKKARRRRKTPETVLQWRAMRDSNLRPTGS